jgi:6-bladed beta-propeller
MKLHLSILSICFFLSNLSSARQQATTILRIDPGTAVGGTAGQIFDEVIYTPLETKKESLFGEVTQLAVVDKYFIVRDATTNSIYIFYRNGKFHSKIKGGDYSINMDNYLYPFSINPSTKEISFRRGQNQVMHYNFDGKKMREEKAVFSTVQFCFLSPDWVAYDQYDVSKYEADSIDYELKLVKKNKIFEHAFPYNKRSGPLHNNDRLYVNHSPFYETGNDTSVFYGRVYDYNTYIITPGFIRNAYRFIIPLTNSLPDDFVTNTTAYGNRAKYIRNHPHLVYNITYTYKIGDNLFFKLNSGDGYKENNDSFIMNLQSGNLISVPHITSDSISAYLPLTDNGDFNVEFANTNFLTCDGEYVYTSHSSLLMFRAKEVAADKNVKYNPVLERYFSKETKKSNPVIVQLKPKVVL